MTASVWGIHDQADAEGRPSGCGYYRIVAPLRALAANGWDCRWQAGTPPAEAGDYRVVVGQRLDNPAVLGIWRRMLARHRLVYEIDDDVFSIDPVNWMAYRAYSRADTQDAVAHAAEVASLVTVTCEPLAEVMRQFNPNVAVIPNFIPAWLLEHQRPRRGRLTVGWAGGASHGWDLAMIATTLGRFRERVPDAEIHLIGTDYRPTIGHLRTRYTHWAPDPEAFFRLIDFDVGLAPLRGTAFDASKTPIKALEYAALGIPVIASDVTPYREFVIDGVTGFLVRSKAQWLDRLRLLAADTGLRESMGAKARELAAGHTMERNWHRWASVYEGLVSA